MTMDLFKRFSPFPFSERGACDGGGGEDEVKLEIVEAMDGLMTTSLPPQQILAAVTSTAAAVEISPSSKQLSRQSSRESGVSDVSSSR